MLREELIIAISPLEFVPFFTVFLMFPPCLPIPGISMGMSSPSISRMVLSSCG